MVTPIFSLPEGCWGFPLRNPALALSRDPDDAGQSFLGSADRDRVEEAGVDVKADRRIVVGDLRVTAVRGRVEHPIVFDASLVGDCDEVALGLRPMEAGGQEKNKKQQDLHES